MDRQRILVVAALLALLPSVGLPVVAQGRMPNAVSATAPAIPINWYTDYPTALQAAKDQARMLFIYFYTPERDAAGERFEQKSLPDLRVRRQLEGYVAVKLPVNTEVEVNGKPTRLLDHGAFSAMEHEQGIAILDFAHPRAEQYGRVVTAVPFVEGRTYQYQPKHLSIILDLPPGTVTQRTLIFAVRIHPEAPASVKGQFDQGLAAEAKSHSNYQASSRVQGHQQWDSRFQRISGRLPWGLRAQEIVAESWPHEGLLDAAIDCVQSWRQSSGHWRAVRSWQPRFGYDMQRGSNGIWYATGIFGNNH